MFTSLCCFAGFCSFWASFGELSVAIVLIDSVFANAEELSDEKKWSESVLAN